MKNRNSGSPYNVLDGKWGGFGLTYWYAGVDSENPLNVFERNSGPNNGILRVWDNVNGLWRSPTDYEGLLWEEYLQPKFVEGGLSKVGEYNIICSGTGGYSKISRKTKG